MLRRSIVTCLLVLAAAPVATAAGPVAHASKKCSMSYKQQTGSLGATYVTSLSASGTSCKRAKGVVKAFNKCRPGKAGRCHKKVKGYSCSEKRTSSPTQYVSKTTCKNGGKTVKFSYSQNT